MSENSPEVEMTQPESEAVETTEEHSKLAEKVVKYGINKGLGAVAGAALGSIFGGAAIGAFLGWLAAEAIFEERESKK